MSTAFAQLLRQSQFEISAPKLAQCPAATGPEVVFGGRSNAGKSSAINALVDHKGLARTSKTPGRTQLINFFKVTDQWRLVDLPGYGFAKVPQQLKIEWQNNMGEYLEKREAIRGLVLVMDVRHPLKEFDLMMLEWSAHQNLAVHVLLSKADKLKRGAASKTLLTVRKELQGLHSEFSVQLFSAVTKQGVDQARQQIAHWFGFSE